MDLLFGLTGELVKEERHAGEEHHQTVEHGVEEQHGDLGFEALHRVGVKVAGLNVVDDRVLAVQDAGRERGGDRAADHGAHADDGGQGSVKPLAGFQLDILQHVGLEHGRQQVGRAELKADEEQCRDEHDLQHFVAAVEVQITDGKCAGVDDHGINSAGNVKHFGIELLEQDLDHQHADRGADAGGQAEEQEL